MLNLLALSTTITIDIMDLLLGILAAVGIVFGIYLIIVLARLAGTMKKINLLISNIQEPVNQTVDQLPGLLKKLDRVADDVSVLTDSAKVSVPATLDDVQTITGTIRMGVETVGHAARAVGEGFASFFGAGGGKAAHGRGFNLSGLADIISQVMTVVGIFTARKSRKKGRTRRRK